MTRCEQVHACSKSPRLSHHVQWPAAVVYELVFHILPHGLENPVYTDIGVGQRLRFVRQGDVEVIVVCGGERYLALGEQNVFFSGGMLNLLDSPVAPSQPRVDVVVLFSLTGSRSISQNRPIAQLIRRSGEVTLSILNNVAFGKGGSIVTCNNENALSSILSSHFILDDGNPCSTSFFSKDTIHQNVLDHNLNIGQGACEQIQIREQCSDVANRSPTFEWYQARH